MRLIADQSGQIRRSAEVEFTFDGAAVAGHDGETVAAALSRAGRLALREGPGDGGPRGVFCAIGVCQECVVLLDGARMESCRLSVRPGMVLERVPSGR
ncbi:hypothetical protein DLJ53_27170 [Acuticoccus sediminis]|uniref:2Fe-2S iron-sulfur cluster protein n=1 Tax=Acuticoccus sediminis TaxID=2184697 RepID=A0A8B2NGJ4_9HYPH|nr:(2Fe-2S)-binding protein [Acuticoccus sediminis]RAH98380.1 hypothetical protein DLJ53_27170 [Acuticoccus sediminis]